jgi:hypothetical protein
VKKKGKPLNVRKDVSAKNSEKLLKRPAVNKIREGKAFVQYFLLKNAG